MIFINILGQALISDKINYIHGGEISRRYKVSLDGVDISEVVGLKESADWPIEGDSKESIDVISYTKNFRKNCLLTIEETAKNTYHGKEEITRKQISLCQLRKLARS